MSTLSLIIFAGVLVTMVSLTVALGGAASKSAKALRRRAGSIGDEQRGQAADAPVGKTGNSVKKTVIGRFPMMEKLAKRYLPRQSILEERLERTGRKVSIGTYALISLGIALGMLVVSFIVSGSPLLAVLIGVIGGVGLPHVVVGRMATKRLLKFTELFPDAIDLIVRGLKSGLPVTESIAAVGREMPDPIGVEFQLISDSVKLGQSLEDALWETAKRLDTPEFKFFVISLSVQRETGGNLGEALANLSDILRRRRQMKLKIKAMSSEAKASAIILGSLPFIMFAIIFAMSPDYAGQLFSDPRGQLMLGVGLGIMSLGILVMNKMVRFDI
ncbi:MAG: type II secretion system F family protein [Alphaproteobacteria bacterium]